jgi:post-segregation antitoxin (ccd killing protein)
MKTKLTITIDRDLVPRAKRYARARGVSLSSLIEETLETMTGREESDSFVDRWRGSMELAGRDDERYRQLIAKYGR